MKSRLFIVLCLGVTIFACNKDKSAVTPVTQNSVPGHHYAGRISDTTDTVSSFISIDVANKMISSYLCSINASQNDSDIQSCSINADSLRAYLSNPAITNVKLMFAHTMTWINAGNSCKYAGFQSGALTIVIAANDVNGNYIYYQGEVLDHIVPCPYTCPPGNAGNNLLQ
jgi:hypothetical protein